MKLARYRVSNFRSVRDSGWLDADSVTALIGVNESGKTNLLLPLWKLKPARDGEVQPTSHYPKTMFGEIRDAPGDYPFVTAEFATGGFAASFAKLAELNDVEAETVRVDRAALGLDDAVRASDALIGASGKRLTYRRANKCSVAL